MIATSTYAAFRPEAELGHGFGFSHTGTLYRRDTGHLTRTALDGGCAIVTASQLRPASFGIDPFQHVSHAQSIHIGARNPIMAAPFATQPIASGVLGVSTYAGACNPIATAPFATQPITSGILAVSTSANPLGFGRATGPLGEHILTDGALSALTRIDADASLRLYSGREGAVHVSPIASSNLADSTFSGSVKVAEVADWLDLAFDEYKLDTQKQFWRFYNTVRQRGPRWLSALDKAAVFTHELGHRMAQGWLPGSELFASAVPKLNLSVRALKLLWRGLIGSFRAAKGYIHASEIVCAIRMKLQTRLMVRARRIFRCRIETNRSVGLAVYTSVRSFVFRTGTPPPVGDAENFCSCITDSGEDSNAPNTRPAHSRSVRDALLQWRTRWRFDGSPRDYALAYGSV